MVNLDISSLFTHVYVSGGKKCLLFGNFDVLCFLETPVLRFALLPYYRQDPLSLPTEESHVMFSHTLYKQIDGLAMSCPLGSSVANDFLAYYEQN